MEKTVNHYFLYCLNMQCEYSVYQMMVETRLRITPENVEKTQKCPCCQKPLVSTLNMNELCIITVTKSQLLFTPAHLSN
jgi:hypothetical protein